MAQSQVAAAEGGIRLSAPSGRWVIAATVLGSGMAMLDATVVNVALPRIGAQFGAQLADLQWTVSAYTLTMASLILLGGSLGDHYGRRRVFLIGVAWFALASALCGLAPSIGVLIAGRALQGIGGALLTPGSLAIIQATFHPDDRPRAIGTWSGLGGIAGAVGPFVGGWLVDAASWRWVFLLNLPLAAVVLAVTILHVPESRDEQAHGRFDVLGAALGALGLAGITYALIEAPARGLTSPMVLGAAAVGLLSMAAFLVWERRERDPMLPLDVFASRQFSASNAVTFCCYAALGGVIFFFVVQLQVVAGFSALLAGAALLPMTILILLLSSRMGALAQRIGPRIPMAVGPAVAAVGVLLMGRVGPGASYVADVLPATTVFGLGFAILIAPLTTAVLAAVETRHAGIASGVNNAVARAAGLLAVAALPLVTGLPADYANRAAFAAGFRSVTYVCALLLVVGAGLAWAAVAGGRPAADRAAPLSRHQCGVGGPTLEPHRRADGSCA